MKRIPLRWLISFVAVGFASGCCHFNVNEPFGPGTGCKPTHCGDCGTCDSCAATPVEAPCHDCGQTCVDPCQRACGPLTWLFDLFSCGYCGDGCGEIYWGDFHGNPPDCCEPCDRHANFTGATSSCGGAAGGSSCCGGTSLGVATTDRVVGPTSTQSVEQAARPITVGKRG